MTIQSTTPSRARSLGEMREEAKRQQLEQPKATVLAPAASVPALPTGSAPIPTAYLESYDLSDVHPEPVEWLWPGWLARGASVILNGRQGDGKGILTASLVAALTSRSHLPDGYRPIHSRVGWLTYEDQRSQALVPRLLAAGADMTAVRHLHRVIEFDEAGLARRRLWQMPKDIDKLRRVITADGLDCVVIDGIGYLTTARGNDYGEVGAAMLDIAELAQETATSIILIRHLRKGGASDARDAGIGSTAWSGVVRGEYAVGRPPDQEETDQRRLRVLAQAKNNNAIEQMSLAFEIVSDEAYGVGRAVWSGTTHVTANELANPPDRGAVTERSEAKDFLKEVLAAGPIRSTTVIDQAREAGIVEKTLRRAKKELGVASRQTADKVWEWSLIASGH